MSKYDAFDPQGPLAIIAAATVAPTPVQVSATSFASLEIINAGAVDVFLCHAPTSAGAAAIAALGIPTVGSPKAGVVPIPVGSDKVYSLRSDEFYTAITASSTANVYLLAGRGV